MVADDYEPVGAGRRQIFETADVNPDVEVVKDAVTEISACARKVMLKQIVETYTLSLHDALPICMRRPFSPRRSAMTASRSILIGLLSLILTFLLRCG